jgi:hypothetical protein
MQQSTRRREDGSWTERQKRASKRSSSGAPLERRRVGCPEYKDGTVRLIITRAGAGRPAAAAVVRRRGGVWRAHSHEQGCSWLEDVRLVNRPP